MSVLSRLAAALTARELQTTLCGRLPGHLPVADAMAAFESVATEHRLRTMPTRRPWSQSPGHAPSSLTLVESQNGEATKVIDMVIIANRYVNLVFQDDLEQLVSEEWKKPLSEIAIPIEFLPTTDITTAAFDVATRLGEIEEKVLLIQEGGTLTGFITFESLQQAAFTLPLFGLILELEEAVLQWMEIKPRECWQTLSEGRRTLAAERATDEFLKGARHIRATGIRTLPLKTALNLWLFPEETEKRMDQDCEQAGAPIELALQMTSFIDKCTVLRKTKAIPSMSKQVLEGFWKKAEAVRNCIAHGRSWWLELTSARTDDLHRRRSRNASEYCRRNQKRQPRAAYDG